MAKAREPRPRALAGLFGAYFLIVVLVTFYLSAPVSVYVDPGATFWILATYVLVGALALTGICAGGLARARTLDARLEDLEAARLHDRRIQSVPRRPKPEVPSSRDVAPVDSGSPEHEIESLLDGLEQMSDAASTEGSAHQDAGAGPEPAPDTMEDLLKADAWEVVHVRRARDAVAIMLLGPALAAVAIVGAFAPLLPSSDGMLLANLQLNAFLGLAGIASLIGLGVYAAAAFRQIRRSAA